MESTHAKATAAIKAFFSGKTTLAEAVLRQGAWWQKVGVFAVFASAHLAIHVIPGALPCIRVSAWLQDILMWIYRNWGPANFSCGLLKAQPSL
jgi:hypothetical protein